MRKRREERDRERNRSKRKRREERDRERNRSNISLTITTENILSGSEKLYIFLRDYLGVSPATIPQLSFVESFIFKLHYIHKNIYLVVYF